MKTPLITVAGIGLKGKADLISIIGRYPLKITLLSAPVSSELPFCKTTLFRKQLISPILFGRSKIGKKDVVLHGLGNGKICKSQCFRKGWLCKLFFKTFG